MRYVILISTVLVLGLCPMAKAGVPSKIMVFGGENHKVYLGCISCNKYDSDSIWNPYSIYGNKYSSDSMWNRYGEYGSRYSSWSPCNVYTDTSPVVVDGAGGYYGHLSISPIYATGILLRSAQAICAE